MNAPSTAVWPRPMKNANSRGRSHSRSAAAIEAGTQSSAVRTIRNRLSPSTPRW